jgi:ABC-2 type transport system permease protein
MEMKKLKNSGSYGILVCVLFTLLVIGINLFVSQLPADKFKIDTTAMKLHTLSENTKEIVEDVSQDVDIYLVCQAGKEDATITDMLNRYADLNKNIHVTYIDPAVYPDFVKQYTKESLDDNSIVVESSKRSQVIDYDKISTYTAFNGEDYLTNAIQYVTSESLPVVYTIDGHGETALSDSLQSSLLMNGLEVKTLNFLTTPKIPDDASAIIINSPTSDISNNELKLMLAYLDKGGKLMLITNYSSSIPNIDSLMSNYGVSRVPGLVLEASENNYVSGYPNYIIPDISTSNDISKPFEKSDTILLVPMAHGIKENKSHRNTLDIETLLSTTNEAYSKTDITGSTSYDKLPQDISGPFSLAVSAEEKYGNYDSRLIWIGSDYFLKDDTDKMVGGSNTNFFLSTMNWLCDRTSSMTITGKSTTIGSLTMTTSQSRKWKIMLIGVIPAAITVFGIIVWLRRRNR